MQEGETETNDGGCNRQTPQPDHDDAPANATLLSLSLAGTVTLLPPDSICGRASADAPEALFSDPLFALVQKLALRVPIFVRPFRKLQTFVPHFGDDHRSSSFT